MQDSSLSDVLERLAKGEITVADACRVVESLARPRTAATDHASIDLDRSRRCGFPEVIFCERKTTAALLEIVAALVAHDQPVLATRASTEQAQALVSQYSDAVYNPVARTIRLHGPALETQRTDEQRTDKSRGRVAVITAGTSDRPVAEEALETLRWMGCETELIVDVGVAGPHRLHEQLERFAGVDAVIVVAGMEGALPSVVGGYVDCPVIAVPTSVGYGASFGGVAALLGMLNSCAANVTVVNIDSGFKGGYVAGLIALRAADKQASGGRQPNQASGGRQPPG